MRHLFALAAFLAFLAPAISHAETLARADEIDMINEAANITYAKQELSEACRLFGSKTCHSLYRTKAKYGNLEERVFTSSCAAHHVDAKGCEAIRAIGTRWAAEHPGYHDDGGFWTVPRAEF